jgi:iron(III) transport system ATP-binding protein
MNHGVIEQVGTPEEIYRQPASVFVADFIGAMSFLAGTAAGAGRVRLGNLDLTATLPDGMRNGEPVFICVRPEDVMVRGIEASTPNQVKARIEELEFLGSFYRAVLSADGAKDVPITADFSINAMRDLKFHEGQSVAIALPPSAFASSRGPRQADPMAVANRNAGGPDSAEGRARRLDHAPRAARDRRLSRPHCALPARIAAAQELP